MPYRTPEPEAPVAASPITVFLPNGTVLYKSTVVSTARGVATDARGYRWNIARGYGLPMKSLTCKIG